MGFLALNFRAALVPANNLSDVENPTEARNNIGATGGGSVVPNSDGWNINEGTVTPRQLTLTGSNCTINQELSNTASPIWVGLTLNALGPAAANDLTITPIANQDIIIDLAQNTSLFTVIDSVAAVAFQVDGNAAAVSFPQFTAGSVLFTGTSGLLTEENDQFFWDDTNKRLSIGGQENTLVINGATIGSVFSIHEESTDVEISTHRHSNTAASSATYYGARSRGTEATETIVVDNDILLTIAGVGFDGTDYATAARIDFKVDGTPGTNDMPCRIEFSTSADGSQVPTLAMTINASQQVGMQNPTPQGVLDVQLGAFASGKVVFQGMGTTVLPAPTLSKIPSFTIFGAEGQGTNSPAQIGLVQPLNDGTTGLNKFSFASTRSTTAQLAASTFTALQSGDGLGLIEWGGDDGTDLRTIGAFISCEVNAAVSSNSIPTLMTFDADAFSFTTGGMTFGGDILMNGASPLIDLVPSGNDQTSEIHLTTTYTGTDQTYRVMAGDGSPNANFRIFDDTAGEDRLIINTNGNIGIGISTSLASIHISKPQARLYLEDSGDVTNLDTQLNFLNNAGAVKAHAGFLGDAVFSVGTRAANIVEIVSNNAVSMTIDTSQNVDFWTTSKTGGKHTYLSATDSSTILEFNDGSADASIGYSHANRQMTFVAAAAGTVFSLSGTKVRCEVDLVITQSNPPASASATGTAGTIAWDTGFIYLATATNTWERVAVATW